VWTFANIFSSASCSSLGCEVFFRLIAVCLDSSYSFLIFLLFYIFSGYIALNGNLSRTFRDAAIWTLWSPVEFGRSVCWPAFFPSFSNFCSFFRSALCRPSGALLPVSFCNYFNKAQCSYFYVLYVPPRKASEETRRGGGKNQGENWGRIAIYDDVARVNISWNGNEWRSHTQYTANMTACHHKCQAGWGNSGVPPDETYTDMFLHIKVRSAKGIFGNRPSNKMQYPRRWMCSQIPKIFNELQAYFQHYEV